VSDVRHGARRWTFLLPGLPRTAGGLIAAYELAGALAAGSSDHVRIAHLPTAEARLRSTDDIPWFRFHPDVEHVFLTSLRLDALPDSDLLVYTVMAIDQALASGPDRDGAALLAHLLEEPGPAGLPILFLQALGVFSEPTELRTLAGSGPKVSVASWMTRNLVTAGVPAIEAVTIVNGVDHAIFRVTSPIEDRPARVAMNHNPHPLKNMDAGIEALERVDRDLGVPAVLYGARPPARRLTGRMQFEQALRQRDLSERVLAASSVYLQPSVQEGFGLSALEAMACGCALVTTDNGGSEDYAIDGETAVLCEADPDSMAEAVTALLRDDARRTRIATTGAEHAAGFRWSDGAERLRDLGRAYLLDPAALRRGPAAPLGPSTLRLHPVPQRGDLGSSP
jgi:glycosyltransferase involved in cell wall biosynthesis